MAASRLLTRMSLLETDAVSESSHRHIRKCLTKMTENKPSKNLWALSSLASTIGAGDFAVEDHDSFRRQEFVFAALNLLLIGALLALQAISKIFRGRPSDSVIVALAYLISFMGAYCLKFGEYIEAGAMAVIYSVMGVLVWLLVNNLRTREAKFARNLEELERTRQQLLSEEKLAAIGRLSRAIAHEIRNPVAMISSSLATAIRPGQSEAEREEMFSIAAKEAVRLERLTTDFLVYARPRPVQVARANLADTLNSVAPAARAHAANEGVTIDVAVDSSLEGDFDATQMHQALLNLVLNAIDACKRGDLVKLDAQKNGNGNIRIDVVDPEGPIPVEVVARIFEPLFTTKQGGNGLGLAIARNIARAHGSDIVLRINEPQRVCFSIEIPAHSGTPSLS